MDGITKDNEEKNKRTEKTVPTDDKQSGTKRKQLKPINKGKERVPSGYKERKNKIMEKILHGYITKQSLERDLQTS